VRGTDNETIKREQPATSMSRLACSRCSAATWPCRGFAPTSRPRPAGPTCGTGVDSTIRLHDLRHWQATQLLDAGVPLPTVASRLGHASGATTMKIYAHRTAHADSQAAGIVSDVLDP